MARGLFYHDTLEPHISGDVSSVTLSTTDKALIPVANIPVLGGNFFSYIGKAVRIRLFGRITTQGTPGNGTFSLYYGTGADANGTIICASAATALTASQTNLSWELDLLVRCRSMGATGTLFGTGRMLFNSSVAASVWMIPSSAPAASGAVDLTSALVLSPQFKRSGSTGESMTVHDVDYTSYN